MYVHRPKRSLLERLAGSARTLAAVGLTALLAAGLTIHWTDASATGAAAFALPNSATIDTIPVAVEGSVVGAGDGLIALVERGAESPVAFPVNADASLTRDGQIVPLDALRVGDTVRMTIDGRTGEVLRLHAIPAASSPFTLRVPGAAAFLAALGFIAGATALAMLNIDRLPVSVTRLQGARLLHTAGAR